MDKNTARIELTMDPTVEGDLRFTAYLLDTDQAGIGATASEALADLAAWLEN